MYLIFSCSLLHSSFLRLAVSFLLYDVSSLLCFILCSFVSFWQYSVYSERNGNTFRHPGAKAVPLNWLHRPTEKAAWIDSVGSVGLIFHECPQPSYMEMPSHPPTLPPHPLEMYLSVVRLSLACSLFHPHNRSWFGSFFPVNNLFFVHSLFSFYAFCCCRPRVGFFGSHSRTNAFIRRPIRKHGHHSRLRSADHVTTRERTASFSGRFIC